MRPASRCEELDVYKLAVELRRAIVRLSSRGTMARDFRFVAQIRDAARGGPRNIAEGFSRFAPREFAHFLSYAKASIDETKTHLVDGYDSGYFSDEQYKELLTLIRRTFGAINGLVAYLESADAARAYDELRRRRRNRPRRRGGLDGQTPEQ